MLIGIPKEIKDNENRVAITPGGVSELVRAGHKVLVQKNAGIGSHIEDSHFKEAGAQIVGSAADVFSAQLVIKVKEPVKNEYSLLREDLVLFCFLHLAPNKELTKALIKSGVIAIGFETVELDDGRLPILAPMSEVAGRMATQAGAHFLEAVNGGRGVLLGGVAGVPPAKVTVLGGGIAGSNAALIAMGMGATVTVIDKDMDRLRYLEETLIGKVATRFSNSVNIKEAVIGSDLVVGAALTAGAKAPTLVDKDIVKEMKKGSVISDIAIDQGGNVATSRPTSLAKPVKVVHGVLHYAVTNIPSAVPTTSTYALSNSTLPWLLKIADKGWQEAARNHPEISKGLNVIKGSVTHPAVAASQNIMCMSFSKFFE
ncbi:hypothetical protein LCGC14_0526870 [marine sediment metagenome]|uniref:alanine dehydrogenase n=1 Tax=marine sediment metagenome TaxID=412755 RepID=A0A0F9RX01_9ZZZZ